jgi:Ser/Thr protein kinase RdoA (MazF antagonist)
MAIESTVKLIQDLLTTEAPAFTAEAAKRKALAHYGVSALRAEALVSERDQNFRLDAIDGRRYVLKFCNSAEQEQVVDFQNQALLHVAVSDPGLPVPRVIPALDGTLHNVVEYRGASHFVRLFSWLEGRVLGKAADEELARSLGRLLARLGLALDGFKHPGSNPSSLWDMKRAPGLRQLLPHVTDPELHVAIGEVLDRFDAFVAPAMDQLRSQVIYGDMNLDNVLVETGDPRRISGLIDFGDLVFSPLVMDLAIAAAYQLSPGGDPLAGALPMIAGFHAVRRLQASEQSLIGDLVKTRLATSLLIGNYRAALFPDNRDYLLTSFRPARTALLGLGRQTAADITRRIEEACVDD